MFHNIGGKIKALAKTISCIGIVCFCLVGLVLMIRDDVQIVEGLLTILLGSLFSWIGSFVIYGFGQLIENSDIMVENTRILIEQNYEVAETLLRRNAAVDHRSNTSSVSQKTANIKLSITYIPHQTDQTYALNLYLDGEDLGELHYGQSQTWDHTLTLGNHTLAAYNMYNSGIKCKLPFHVGCDRTVAIQADCYDQQIVLS